MLLSQACELYSSLGKDHQNTLASHICILFVFLVFYSWVFHLQVCMYSMHMLGALEACRGLEL